MSASTMKAVVVSALTDPLSLKVETLPIPEPTAGSVVVQVLSVVIADFQRQVLSGTRGYPLQLPLTPGGNGIARVHAIGPDTTSLSVGQLVFIDIYIRARDDPSAGFLLGFHSGFDPAAVKLSSGLWRNGTNAQFANLPIENVHLLDEEKLCKEMGYSIEDLLTIQSVCIPFGGLDDAGVQAGDTVIVSPATGTFGGAAVLAALAMGARVIACGRSQAKLDAFTAALGSPAELFTVALSGDVENDSGALLKITGSAGADVYIDFSPPEAASNGQTPTYILAAIGALRQFGTAVLMGGITGNISIPYGLVMFKSLAIRGKFMYERAQLRKLIKLAELGRLKLGKTVGKKVLGPFGIDQIEEAMEVAEKNPGYSNLVILKP